MTGTASPTSIFAGAYRVTSIGIITIVTLIAFEAMAVAAALPTAARDLHGVSGYGWAFTGFLIADVVGMVVSGQLTDARGPRVPLTAGLLLFPVGLVISGSAGTMTQLVAGRVVQGFGGGLLITALYVVIGTRYPNELSAKVFAALSSAWVVPALVGPLVAGSVTQHLSWRWVFLGLVPFVFVGAGLLVPTLRQFERPARPRPRIDPLRTLRALSTALGVAGLQSFGEHATVPTAVLAVGGIAALWWGLAGLLPPGTFRAAPGVAAPIAFRGLLAGSFFGVESLIPLSMTVQHHFSPVTSALPLALSGTTWAFGSWVQGRHPSPDGPGRVALVRWGFLFVAVSAAAVSVAIQPGLSGYLMYPAWGLAGVGAGMTMSSASVLLLSSTNDDDRGSDSAAIQISDAVSGALTTGFAGVMVALATRSLIGYTAAFRVVDLTMAGVALLGVIAAGRARTARAGGDRGVLGATSSEASAAAGAG